MGWYQRRRAPLPAGRILRRVRAGLGAIVVLAAVTAAAGAQAAPAACPPAGAKTVAISGGARLYIQGGSLYGCLGTRATRLGAAPAVRLPGSPRVALSALSPRYAGIDLASMDVDTFSATVAVVDLRRARASPQRRRRRPWRGPSRS